jgi:hypothetical protein
MKIGKALKKYYKLNKKDRKNTYLESEDASMFKQNPKNLLYWLLIDSDAYHADFLAKIHKADDWVLSKGKKTSPTKD